MAFVKICGVTRPEHVEAAVAAGADFIGLMFAEQSRRRVTVEQAKRLMEALPARAGEPVMALALPAGHTGPLWFDRCATALEGLLSQRRPLVVGVFADQPASLINSIAEMIPLDLVQLSGNEAWDDILAIRRPVVKAEKVAPTDEPDDITRRTEAGTASLLLLDTAAPGQGGGTGQAFDWEIGRRVAERLPVMLAGGLSPANVGAAIAQVHPWAVDVSSGVETDGVKDVAKIAAFIAAARAATAKPLP